jgi:hypothetical protein
VYQSSPGIPADGMLQFDGVSAPLPQGSLNSRLLHEDEDATDDEDAVPLARGVDYGGDEASSSSSSSSSPSSSPFKQTRVQTIMSIVNTMMGTTIVALPFGLAESGIGTGLGITALLGAISCYTCLIIVESGAGAEDFSTCVRQFLGRRMQLVAWAISVAIIVGAAIVYHILMQETLYALVATLLQSAAGVTDVDGTGWRREWAALVPWFLYPISNLPDLSTLVKMNSVGFLFLAYVVLFIISHGVHAISQGGAAPLAAVSTLDASLSPYSPSGILRIVVGGTSNFAALGGMMMLSFFIHNCIQPIVKNANPVTRRTDIIIAYTIAGLLYSCVGVLGYVGFADAHAAQDCMYDPNADVGGSHAAARVTTIGDVLWSAVGAVGRRAGWALDVPAAAMPSAVPADLPGAPPCVLKSNFLAMFGTALDNASDGYAFSARLALLFQLFTVFPILLLIIRTQVFTLILGTPWPGYWRVAGLNFAIMAVSFAFAATDLQISEVLRFVGAIGGFVIVYAVPAAIDLLKRRRGGDGLRRGGGRGGGGVKADGEEGLLESGDGGGDGGDGDGGEEGPPQPIPLIPLVADVGVVLVGLLFLILQFVPSS